MTIYHINASLITGQDAHGNEYAYWKSSENNEPEQISMGKGDEWFDVYEERFVSARHVENYVYPNIVKVRFGELELNRYEWTNAGCPLKLSSIEISAWLQVKQKTANGTEMEY